MAKFFLTMLLAAFLVSCELLDDLNDLLDLDTPLKSDQFYAVDFKKEKFYKVTGEKLAEGEKCVIWAEKGSKYVNKKTAEEIAAKYDDIIRPKIVGAFGMKNISKNITVDGKTTPYHFNDILDYANWLANKDNNKLTILLLDIKDNFKDKTKDSYVAGYFYSGNFNKRDEEFSNGCDMIYVDTYPGLNMAPEQTYATFAHELQHLINYATTTLKRGGRAMDTWIDEGLSSQAEHIYYEGVNFDGKDKIFDGYIKEHCRRFSDDEKGTIAKGNNFFVWGNNPDAILDEYSTVYLFFRWLYLQADSGLSPSIFREIEEADLSDHRVVTNVAKKIRPEWADWASLLRNWLAANYNPANSNYGYKDVYFHNKIKVKPLKTTNKTISLYPGEGVYSNIKNSFTPSVSGANIRYAGLSSNNPSSIMTQPPYTSNVLLTFNANTSDNKPDKYNKFPAPETGSITGVSASISSTSNSRTATEDAQTETHTGPYVIDARDYNHAGILGRNK